MLMDEVLNGQYAISDALVDMFWTVCTQKFSRDFSALCHLPGIWSGVLYKYKYEL